VLRRRGFETSQSGDDERAIRHAGNGAYAVRVKSYSGRVTLDHSEHDPGDHLPPTAELAKLIGEDRLVLLPDQIVEASGERIAGFRPGCDASTQ
jgi:hypothetical protein